jgi:RNA polymerase sigma-70 factor (ECF subfamily)
MTGGDEAGSELAGPDGPDEQAVLAETLGPALLLLDTLSPSGSLAFVLDDLFAFPFEGNAPVVDRTPAAARQLASRARRHIQGADRLTVGYSRHHREIVIVTDPAVVRSLQTELLS